MLKIIQILNFNPFFPIVQFFTSGKHQEISGFLMPLLGEMSQNIAQSYQYKQRIES